MDLDKLIKSESISIVMHMRDALEEYIALPLQKQRDNSESLALKIELMLKVFNEKIQQDKPQEKLQVKEQPFQITQEIFDQFKHIQHELHDLRVRMDQAMNSSKTDLDNHSSPAKNDSKAALSEQKLTNPDSVEPSSAASHLPVTPSQIRKSRDESAADSAESKKGSISQKQGATPQTVADAFSKPTVRNEAAAATKNSDSVARLAAISSLKKGMTINDRRLFRAELADGDDEKFRAMIEQIDAVPSLEEALNVLQKYYKGSADNPVLQQFIELLERRFLNE